MNKERKTSLDQTVIILSGLAVAAFVFVFYPVWLSLIELWINSEEYSHGFFIVPIALFIAWQKRDILAKIPVKGAWGGLLVVLAALFLYLIGDFAHILTLKPLAMILFFGGSILFLFGYRVFYEMLFPLFILLFMLPIPSQIYSAATINLQLFVSAVSANLVSIIGVTLYREGNVIHLPEMTMQVVQACSGMRSLVSLLALSSVFGYFSLRSNFLRTILFFSGIPIAVIVNVVRVIILIGFVHYLGIDLTHGLLHTILGLAVFVLAIALLFMFRGIIKRWETP